MAVGDLDVVALMRRAIDASVAAQGSSSPNPPVGAVILGADGKVVGIGHTQPPGGPHAEVMALRAAGERARDGIAIVTLEPCNHTGRTGPCAQALIEAGVTEVHYGVADPNPAAAGGAETLRRAGVLVTGGVAADEITSGPLQPWLHRQQHGRPFVTVKLATTIDGRIAAPDGTSKWITGPGARAVAHRQRSRIDAIVVGTGTALADDPSLTARRPDDTLYDHQPIRVVVGDREVPDGAKLRDGVAPFVHVRSHDPAAVLDALDDALWVLVEGGATLVGAFFAADLVDELAVFVAPTVLGAGRNAVDIPGITTLAGARRFETREVRLVDGGDVFIRMTR